VLYFSQYYFEITRINPVNCATKVYRTLVPVNRKDFL